jgi:membrane-associated phospholipid phosphatase
MKKKIFIIALVLLPFCTWAQKPASYEAANWKLWQLDNPAKITIAAAPAPTKAEIQAVKQAMSTLNDEKREAIRYWNAGAPAYRWNEIQVDLIGKFPETQLKLSSAWLNLAIYDATVLAWKEKLKYKRKRPHEADASVIPVIDAPKTYGYPCEHSVTASVAAHVLAYFYPAQSDSLLKLAKAASQSRIDAGVQFPADVEAGWKLGEQVALQIIEKAKKDGSDKQWNGQMNKDPKKWTGSFPMGITMASYVPMFMKSNDQFRPLPPPDFEKDMQEMRDFKQTFKSASIAYYWANTSDYWLDMANKKMFENGIDKDAAAAARIYAIIGVALRECVIATFDAKYTYWGIRPVQYDTTYKPLIGTPPFPGYPSGHAAGAGTGRAVLSYFFPQDAALFDKAAKECAESRFYAGIHFRTDNDVALDLGKSVADYVLAQWMGK